MQLPTMPSFSRWGACVPLIAGVAWIGAAAHAGWLAFALAALPGSVLLASGVAAALWPGDPRPLQAGSLAAAVGIGLGLISIAWAGILGGFALAALSGTAFFSVGALSLAQQIPTLDVPPQRRSLSLAGAVAIDEALLGAVVTLALRRSRDGILREGIQALEFFGHQGWLEKPHSYHVAPPPLEQATLRTSRTRGIEFEHLSFESGYEPHAGEPGGERWRGYASCRTAHAWVMRHDSPERPWLMCVHGLQMGWPLADLTVFRARWLHHKLGLNLIFPVLPLHGPRGHGRISGNGFLSEQILDTVHAFAQASWDLRRLISWIRCRGGTRIGIHGISLGGYTAALLASLEDGLACAIPGIPAVDFAGLTWRHAPPQQLQRFEREGLGRAELEQVLRPVAPLALTPKVPKERRYIYGGTADRLVPPDQVHALWRHWDQPTIHWYTGSHVSFMFHAGVRRFIEQALRDAGLVT